MMQKRGTMIKYKNIEAEETEDFWNFLTVLDKETDCMMYEPGERAIRSSLEELKEDIFSNVIHGEDFLCIALDDGRIVGYLRAERGKCNRIRHTAYIVTGILKSYRERGIGTAFFSRLDKWAEENQIYRLELSVECPNEAARHLYERSGFSIEGIRKSSMYVNGEYVDEYYMAKISG